MVLVEGYNAPWVFYIAAAAHLHQFSVQMNHLAGAGALMQVVNVLSDDRHVPVFFELRQNGVRLIGTCRHELTAELVVELIDELGIFEPSFVRGNPLHAILLP